MFAVEAGEGDFKSTFWICECGHCNARFDKRTYQIDFDSDKLSQAAVNREFYDVGMNEERVSEELEINRGMISGFMPFVNDRSLYVEIGCGLGFLTRAASPYFEQCIGLDLEVETAESIDCQIPNVKFELHDNFLGRFTGNISALAAWHVLEHLPEPHGMLGDLFSKISRSGIFFGQVPLFKTDYVMDAHYIFYDEVSLCKLTRPHGFVPLYMQRDEGNSFLSFCFRKI
ncbi:MAG: methyltransferase domain-containing protein [Sphingomonadales bacterium]|nr:methyltransferase domain-containing protein [Sphingomonadales bacterium]